MTEIRVSDHAVLRYLERVVGLDIEALRAFMADECARAGRAPCVRTENARYIVRGRRVVTVLDNTVIPHWRFLALISRENGGGAMNWPFESLVPFKYGAILADPPWAYKMRSAKGYAKSPEAHYRTMSEAEISALPVGHLASDTCLLWLWSTWPHLEVALRVMKAWGFTYKTGGSWTKLTSTGKRAMGGGYIFRSTTEPFLIGTIGAPQLGSKSIRNLIESERREHSRKPPEAREMIDRLRPDVFACELFAREPWAGRDVWGLEQDKFGAAA